MIKVVVDEVLVPRDLGPLLWIAPALVGLTLARGRRLVLRRLPVDVDRPAVPAVAAARFFRHLQGLSLDFFERRRLGDLVSRLTGNIAAIESFVLSGVARAVSSASSRWCSSPARCSTSSGGSRWSRSWSRRSSWLLVAPFSARIKQAAREKQRRSGSMTAVAEESLVQRRAGPGVQPPGDRDRAPGAREPRELRRPDGGRRG